MRSMSLCPFSLGYVNLVAYGQLMSEPECFESLLKRVKLTESLSCALLVSRTDSGPGGHRLVGCKARHIRANLCDDTGCRYLFDAHNALHQLHCFLKRVQVLLHLRL